MLTENNKSKNKPQKNKRKILGPKIWAPILLLAVLGGVLAAIILATGSEEEKEDTLGANSTATPNASATAPPVYPEVLVQCPWFPDLEMIASGGLMPLPLFVLDVRDIPAYDPAEPLTLSLWMGQEDPIYPYRYHTVISLDLESPNAGPDPSLTTTQTDDSSSSSSGSDSSSTPTDSSSRDLFAALGALQSFGFDLKDIGPSGQNFFAEAHGDLGAELRRSDFWPGLNLSGVPGEAADPGSVPDMYTRKVVQAQHEKDFLYAQLTLPFIGGSESDPLDAQFVRVDGGEAKLTLLRNQSEDPDLYSVPLGGPGLFMASYTFAGAPLSVFMPSCSFWIYVVDSGPEVSAPQTCAEGFPLQEWSIESESEEGPPQQVAWCNCFDTCGGWNDGAFCEDYSLEESADVYDLLNCGENNMKVVNLTLMDEGLVIDVLHTVFHGVCLPAAYTAEMVQVLRDRYEVTALFELERAADPALGETEAVVFATPQMEVSDYVFHAFDENVVETPWGEVAQLLSNMSVGTSGAHSYDWEVRIVVRVAAEGGGVGESTCRVLVPEPYCNPELDSDSDEANDCIDECRDDPAKSEAGECGCGEVDDDTDGDKTADCVDACPNDVQKVSSSGVCGCGVPDTDTDGDTTPDCSDACPADPGKGSSSGMCGCGVPDDDSDSDGVPDCLDACPGDPVKIVSSGVCGCGVADDDLDSDGAVDCPAACGSATQPNITSISNDSGAAGLSITLTGSWPLAVPGADVRVLTWFNGSLSDDTADTVVTFAAPTTITFEAPAWNVDVLSDREVQFTVLVLPAGTPSSGHPTTCSSTAGQSPAAWEVGQFATFTYETFVVTLSSTTLSCDRTPINVTVHQPPSTSINAYSIAGAADGLSVAGGNITGYPTNLTGYQVSFSFEVTPSDSTSPITITLSAGVLHGTKPTVGNPETTLQIEGERADSDSDGVPDCHDGCPADPQKSVSGACGCGEPDVDTDSDGTADCLVDQ